MTKDVISLSISVLLLFRHYISHKITFGAPPAVAGYYAVLAVLLFFHVFFGVLIPSTPHTSSRERKLPILAVA